MWYCSDMTLPPLPEEFELNWFSKRNAFDIAVKGFIEDGGGGVSSWDDLEDKPPVIAAGATQVEARTAIGAASVADLEGAGAGGGTLTLRWNGTTYSVPGSAPSGVLVRHFVGPVNPSTLSIPAWSGVTDLYTYAI